MKLHKKMAALTAAGVLSVSCLAMGIPAAVHGGLSAVAVDDNNDDWLHAEGSRLYDSQGNEVWLTGANWFGFNCTENCAHGLYASDVDDFLENVSNHGINLIRMPISTELLDGGRTAGSQQCQCRQRSTLFCGQSGLCSVRRKDPEKQHGNF